MGLKRLLLRYFPPGAGLGLAGRCRGAGVGPVSAERVCARGERRFPAECSVSAGAGRARAAVTPRGGCCGCPGASQPWPHENGAKVLPSYSFLREAEGRQSSASGCFTAGSGALCLPLELGAPAVLCGQPAARAAFPQRGESELQRVPSVRLA